MLKEEVKVTAADKDEVKDIMKALLNFGMIAESTEIHSLVEKLMKAENSVKSLMTIEQTAVLEKTAAAQIPIQEMFPEFFDKQKRMDDFQKALAEWRDVKFFKH